MTVTLDCSFKPRCLYCNQAHLPTLLGMEDWKRLIEEAAIPDPPYVYISGGEPLLLGEAIWGDHGLAIHAARLGCAVNINTNAALISPRVAMHIVKSGVSRVHISLDAAAPEIQAVLFRRPARVGAVWRGIRNLLIARETLGSDHPRIHINCVLTRLNLDSVPALLRAVWSMRPVPPGAARSLDDFAFHLIPVGGQSNASLRPSAEQWRRFYTETWDEAGRVWQAEQESAGVAEPDLQPLDAVVPFANPFLRVDHHMTLDKYCEVAAQGVYWQGALCEACWVAPTQAYVLPDGSQHWCGGHAIRRPEPMGDVRDACLRANIRAGVEHLSRLPGPECAGCAGATCVINQATVSALRAHVRDLLEAHRAPRGAP
jgi:MoaA/NifB/PqqE/SkfB family radical SAM enzyme